jgi:hypothetical protein
MHYKTQLHWFCGEKSDEGTEKETKKKGSKEIKK